MADKTADPAAQDSRASAILRDAFALSGRGTVIVCDTITGRVHIGAVAKVAGIQSCVTGIEMIRYSDPSSIPGDRIGLLVAHPDVGGLRRLSGHTIHFERVDKP